MEIVLEIHSLVRFVLLLVAIIGLGKAIITLLQSSTAEKLDQTLAAVFVGLYDLQALLGILIIFLGGLLDAIHPVVMFVGILAAHGLQSMTKRGDGRRAQFTRLALFIVPLVIILLGLAAIGHLPV